MIFRGDESLANFAEDIRYIEKEGIYRGTIENAYLAEVKAQNGSDMNSYVFLKFRDKASGAIANLSFFVAKNGKETYLNNEGKPVPYLDYRKIGALLFFIGVEQLEPSKLITERVFGNEMQVKEISKLIGREYCLGLNAEEYVKKNGDIGTKMIVERIFNPQGQSLNEFKHNEKPNAYKFFTPKRLSAYENKADTKVKLNQSYDPYSLKSAPESSNQGLNSEPLIELEDENNGVVPF